jgi:hypothetical protein
MIPRGPSPYAEARGLDDVVQVLHGPVSAATAERPVLLNMTSNSPCSKFVLDSSVNIQKKGRTAMLILIIILLLVFGVGGGYYGHTRWGPGGGAGIGLGTILLILLIAYMLGLFR